MRSSTLVALVLLSCRPAVEDQASTQLPTWQTVAPDITMRDRIIGLIALPQLFGRAPCEAYDPVDVILYDDPSTATPTGVIRVDTPWTPHEFGGCEGLSVSVRIKPGATVMPLPTLEYAYEMPGAIVLDRHRNWFRIRLADGAGWIRTDEREFMTLAELLSNSFTYIASPDGLGLAAEPGSPDRSNAVELVTEDRVVRLLETHMVNDDLWLRIEIQSDSPCESITEPVGVATGWIPAYAPGGDPIIWFYSRGC